MSWSKRKSNEDAPVQALPDPEALPEDGVRVPLAATFMGIKALPWWALGHNSMYPRLVIYPDRVEYVLFFRRERHYGEIERVEARTTLGTRNLEFVWRQKAITFTANIRSEYWRVWVLDVLSQRGVALGPGAQRLLGGEPK